MDSPEDPVAAQSPEAWERTERRQIEDALRASEDKYRALVESINYGFCTVQMVFDADDRPIDYVFLDTNHTFERNTGLMNVIGKSALTLVPDLEPFWIQAYGRVALTGVPERFEQGSPSMGRVFQVDTYRVGDPALRQVAILFDDITQRRHAEEELRARETRFRTLIEHSADAIQLVSLDGTILYSSDSVETVLGYTPAEIQGKPVVPYVHPDDLARVMTWIGEIAEVPGAVGSHQYRVQHRDGSWVWVETTITNHLTTPGIEAVVGNFRNITERRRMVDALRESEARFRTIVEQATDYVIFTTDTEHRIDSWLPGAQAVLGWTADEAIGQLFDVTFTPEDRAEGVPEGEFARARDTGSAPDVRWHVHKDGRRVFIEGMTVRRKDALGAFQGVFKIGQDVTERRLLEQQQRETEEHIRHELEAQVAEATLELRTLSRRLLEVQEEERRHLARELHDEIGQMLTGLNFQLAGAAADPVHLIEAQRMVQQLTDQVRQLSMDLRPAVLDRYGLRPALEWHLERYQHQTGIRVDVEADGLARRFPSSVEITAFRVVQEALTNVARHAGSQEATVQVTATAGALTIRVQDHGRGFSLKTVRDTSGLRGMRERVALLGGTLTVESRPGRGTILTAFIPLDHSG